MVRRTLAAWILVLTASAGSTLAAEGLTLVRPADGETIHDNEGRVVVVVSGDSESEGFQAYLDGAPMGGIHPAPAFHLEGIDRGEHRLSVTAVNAQGRTLAATEAITFYMWRASRLAPNRQ
jgi:hypothetical protein